MDTWPRQDGTQRIRLFLFVWGKREGSPSLNRRSPVYKEKQFWTLTVVRKERDHWLEHFTISLQIQGVSLNLSGPVSTGPPRWNHFFYRKNDGTLRVHFVWWPMTTKRKDEGPFKREGKVLGETLSMFESLNDCVLSLLTVRKVRKCIWLEIFLLFNSNSWVPMEERKYW